MNTMNRRPSRKSRLNVITFDENPDNPWAAVIAYKAAWKENLAYLAQQYPGSCILQRASADGLAVEYAIPKKWVKIVARHVYSDAALESKAASYKRRREEYFAALEAAEAETPAAAPQPGEVEPPPQEESL